MHFRLSAALAVVAAVILSPLAAYAQVPNVGNTRCVSNCSSTSADCSPATIAAAQDAVAKMPGIIAKESAQLAAGVSNPQQVTDDIALARRLLAAGQSILASCQGAGAAPAAPAAPPAPAPQAAPPGPSGGPPDPNQPQPVNGGWSAGCGGLRDGSVCTTTEGLFDYLDSLGGGGSSAFLPVK